MTPLAILQLLLQTMPTVLPLIDRVRRDIAAGRGDVPLTEADWEELRRLGNQSAADIFTRAGVTPPPPSNQP